MKIVLVSILTYLKSEPVSFGRWLMPVNLASWETEMQRVTVPDQPGQKKAGYGGMFLSF
jgi:hypothetical protein